MNKPDDMPTWNEMRIIELEGHVCLLKEGLEQLLLADEPVQTHVKNTLAQLDEAYMTCHTGAVVNVENETTRLRTALSEAMGWNWLQHADAEEAGDTESQIPKDVVEQCTSALGESCGASEPKQHTQTSLRNVGATQAQPIDLGEEEA